MKKTLLALASVLLFGSAASAQGQMVFNTAAEVGTEIRILPNALSATSPVSIDFGDGEVKKFTVDPKAAAYNRWITGEVKGETITVSGNVTEFELSNARLTSAKISGMSLLTELDLSDNEIASFELTTITPLQQLDLSHNKLVNSPSEGSTLTLEFAAETLKKLNLSYNDDLQCLHAAALNILEDLNITNCKNFASIFICTPEEKRESLKYLYLNDCSISHFYPINLPALRVLDLSGNNLMTEYDDNPFEMGNYPELRNFSISNNKGIKSVDVSDCPLLNQLYVNGCDLSQIDVSACSELTALNIADNEITSLDLSNNKEISSLMVNGNPLEELDLDPVPNVSYLNISDTQISRINLMKAYFLQSFRASNTKLEWVDFGGQQPERMKIVDIRNNPNFTAESMSYTLHTLPVARKQYSSDPNLLLEGSNAEHADTQWANSVDWQWISDVKGDGTAVHSPLTLTFDGATKTGTFKKGTVDRLYPYMALSLDYNLEVMHTDDGDFVVTQWKPIYFQSIKDASDGEVLKGVPVCVYTYPAEGKRFRSLTVNGKEIFSPWFILSENATVKVNFQGELSSIALGVNVGQDLSFRVNTIKENDKIWIDWGNGGRAEYDEQRAYTGASLRLISDKRIEGKALGNTVTIYGDLAGLDIDGYGDVAEIFGLWDNNVQSLDISNAPDLKILTAYFNPIRTLDISRNSKLEVLNVSFTAIQELDLSNCPNLMSLEAYASGIDEEENIRPLKSIDLTKLPILQNLNVKNNGLASIDLTQNPYLRWVDICGNKFTSVDLSKNPVIETLNLMNNKLTAIDVSAQAVMTELDLDNNELTAIDLSKNPDLELLMIGNNHIKTLDIANLTNLRRLYINGNGMTADDLNDLFYKLPQRRPDTDEEQGGMQTSWNLCIYQGTDKDPNDYNGHDSSIAVDRGWSPSHSGSNAGSDVAYLDLLSAVHGSYTVKDAAGNTYTHGSKVEKWLPLTVEAQPEAGYALYSLQLNDDAPILGANTFEMPGIYTKLRVNFTKTSAIDGINADAFGIRALRGAVEVKAAAATPVEVFAADGRLVAAAETDMNGAARIALAPGFYIVKADGQTASVAVK